MDFFDQFLEVLAQLETNDVEYVLIGGFAVVLHGYPRLTQDVVLFVRPTETNIHKLKAALHNVFSDPSIDHIQYQDFARYSVIRYGTPNGFSIDLITSIGEAFSYEDIDAEIMELEGHQITIATPESLLEMKQRTMREVDAMDVRFLRNKIKQR